MTNHDDATTAKDTGRILTGGALSRRKHYETTSRWIAEKRDELYSAVPINHIVQLAFHTTPTLLAGFENIDVVIRAVSAQYQSDLFGDWQKFCRALNAEQRSWALFEGALFFAAECISNSEARDNWLSSCRNHGQQLKRLVSLNEAEKSASIRQRKRKRGTQGEDLNAASRKGAIRQQVYGVHSVSTTIGQLQATTRNEAITRKIAMFATLEKLESVLGHYLFSNMDASCRRCKERGKSMMTYTDAVRLHLPYEEGMDFKLEVWLRRRAGQVISKARSEDVRSLMGEYLFTAMEASDCKNQATEESLMCTDAMKVDLSNDDDDDDDARLEVVLCFAKGKEILAEAYPC